MGAHANVASVDTADAAWLNALLSSLGGVTVNATVAQDQSLVAGTISLGALRDALGPSVGDPLDDAMSLADVLLTLGSAANMDGDTLAAASLDALAGQVAGVTGDVRIGDFLDIVEGANDAMTLPLRDLVIDAFAAAQVARGGHAATVAVSSALLADVDAFEAATISVWTVEGADITVGAEGAVARAPHLRVQVMATPVAASIGVNGVAAIGSVSLTLAPIAIVLDLAPGTMTITDVSPGSVTVAADPGIVTAYLGTVSQAVFEDRSSTIDPATDVTAGVLANLQISVLAPVLQGTAIVRAKATASADAGSSALTFDGPFPQTIQTATGAGVLDSLIDGLLSDLDVEVTSYVGLLGLSLADQTTIGGAVADLLASATSPITSLLDEVVGSVVDPLTAGLGVRLGGMDVSVFGLSTETDGVTCGGGTPGTCRAHACCTGCWNGTACVGGGEATACGSAGAMCASCDDALFCTVDACVASACTHTVEGGCLIAGRCFEVEEIHATNTCQFCASDSNMSWSAIDTAECRLDTDGDGVPDVEEDANGNGDLDDDDTDGDGIPDYRDPTDDRVVGEEDVFGVRGGALCAVTAPGHGLDGAPAMMWIVIGVGLLVRRRRGNG